MIDKHLFTCLIIVSIAINICQALECYVCENQEDNEGKCTRTIQTCQYGEDTCQTEISWGTTPYWQEGALKQHYISKRCSTKEKCEKHRRGLMDTCTHIWYQDWKCSECCRGDRCNYYIISGATVKTYHASVLISTFMALFYHFYL
ncbi:unnamed protein product [Brassicogethes aeneus]|uniref:Uncharacterized protein n=1 Tax=Brassicogethes aeneus TaxID=1431903 RepID=A0A9P0B5X1_BRAAE|nr:unnamed protein product [Brassicogethes aeneus]